MIISSINLFPTRTHVHSSIPLKKCHYWKNHDTYSITYHMSWTSANCSSCQRWWRRLPFNLNRGRSFFLPSAYFSQGIRGELHVRFPKTVCRFTKDSASTSWSADVFGCIKMKQPFPPLRYQHDLRRLCLSRGDGPMTAPCSDTLDCRWLTHLTVPLPKTLHRSHQTLFSFVQSFCLPASFERITEMRDYR